MNSKPTNLSKGQIWTLKNRQLKVVIISVDTLMAIPITNDTYFAMKPDVLLNDRAISEKEIAAHTRLAFKVNSDNLEYCLGRMDSINVMALEQTLRVGAFAELPEGLKFGEGVHPLLDGIYDCWTNYMKKVINSYDNVVL